MSNPDRFTILHISVTYKKVGTWCGTLLLVKTKSLLSFIPDRSTILHISVTYKKVGTWCGTLPQGRNLKRHIAALVAVFVGYEDYFYPVLVALMSHYDIIVANSVGA